MERQGGSNADSDRDHAAWAAVCFAFAGTEGLGIAACKVLWCFIWFWAAVSKINHHFPSVIMVMMNNGPFFPKWLKRRLFVSYPDDLRPSRVAATMAHFGAATEFLLPFLMIATTGAALLAVSLLAMVFHTAFAASENMLVARYTPFEWRALAYGAKFVLALGVGGLTVHVAGRVYDVTGSFDALYVAFALLGLMASASAVMLPRARAAGVVRATA